MIHFLISRSKAQLTASAWVLVALFGAADPIPPIGKIDFYGLQTIRAQALRNELGLKEGDPTPVDDQPQLEQRLEKIAGVVKAKIVSVCCEDGKSTVFVGIQEQATRQFDYNPRPNGTVSLPEEMVQTYDRFMEALAQEVQQGNAGEDDSQGHALYSAKALQPFQKEFMALANSRADLLKDTIKKSADPKHRAVAAWVLGYAQDKRTVLNDLMHAVRDVDEGVRNNATRAVGTIAVLARAKPELGIRVEPGVFIQMLNSLSWSDRNKAMMVLLHLTGQNASEVLRKLREEALPSLIEMARWQDGHSLMALQLVGRIAGRSDKESDAAWRDGRREQIISKALER